MSTWLALGVIAFAMTAQVFAARGMNTFMAESCSAPAVVAVHDDCCGSDDAQQATTRSLAMTLATESGEPEPTVPCCPCDGPCDCQTCFRVLMPSPMMATLTGLLDLPMTSSLSALRHETMPKWLALSVAVQPPIV